jgi:uroporphyrinogen-III synthase
MAAALRARGHQTLVAPVLCMERMLFEIADQPYAAVIMTSANAARVIAENPARAALLALPAFTVGEHTARAAAAAGFHSVLCAHGDRNELARMVRDWCGGKDARLLYLAGEARAADLNLAPAVAEIVTAVIYRMIAVERFPEQVETALANRQIDAVLHFSRRSAEAFIACVGRAGALDHARTLLHFCLSRQVAQPLADIGIDGIRIAAHPDEGTLIRMLD